MKKFTCVILITAFVILALAGCGATGELEAQQSEEETVSAEPTAEATLARDVVPDGISEGQKIALIGVARSTSDEEYISQVFAGAKREGEAFGFEIVTFIATNGKEDLAQTIIENCDEAGFAGYIVSEDTAAFTGDLLGGAQGKGVKLVGFDSLSNRTSDGSSNLPPEGAPVVSISENLLAKAALEDMVVTLGKPNAQVIRVAVSGESAETAAAYQELEDSGSITTLEVINDREMAPVATDPPAEESDQPEESESAEQPGEEGGMTTQSSESSSPEASESPVPGESESVEPQETESASPTPAVEMEEVDVDVAKRVLEFLPTYKTGNLDAVWCPNTVKAAEIVQILKDAGRTEVKVFSTGISTQVINLMRANPGTWVSTAAASPDTVGVVCMRMMAMQLGGEEVQAQFELSGSVIKASVLQEETTMNKLSDVVPDFYGAPLTEEFLNEPWMDVLRAKYAPPEESAQPSDEQADDEEAGPEDSEAAPEESEPEESPSDEESE